jgi:hypothetical protein
MNIRDYWIDELQEIKEFQIIDAVENPEINSLNSRIQNLIDDQFIETATEIGIARREKTLKITPFVDDTLETRRFRLRTRNSERTFYTYNVLINKLNQLCGENGYESTLNTKAYTLNIKIELTQKRMLDDVRFMSRRIVPANIVITVELRYNQHLALSRYTHAQLKTYTHKQLREEAL